MIEKTNHYVRALAVLVAAIAAALVMASGTALAVTKSCEAGVACVGTKNPDTLNGTANEDHIFGRGAADTLKGFGATDELFGQGGADKLFGAAGTDYLLGGPANDVLSGGADFDRYHFGPGWGKESITDSATPANLVAFYVYSASEDGVFVSENLTIKLIAGEGPEVKTASGISTINWEANVIEDVQSGSGDDRITGNHLDNDINANSGGADNIFAGAGDDLIIVSDGSGDDVVDCGEDFVGSDSDRVVFDLGDQIASNCEDKQGPA